jgi:hypothetical protein
MLNIITKKLHIAETKKKIQEQNLEGFEVLNRQQQQQQQEQYDIHKIIKIISKTRKKMNIPTLFK